MEIKFEILAGGLTLALAGHALGAPPITVTGWDFSAIRDPGNLLDFGNDPVVGRLVCPPLSRLDMHDQGSEPFVLKTVMSSPDNREWIFALRSNVLWWSGQAANAEDLKKFLQGALSDAGFKDRLTVTGALPDYNVELLGPGTVKIIWSTAPAFGPYIFDGFSFSRNASAAQKERSQLDFECVGRYSGKIEGQGSTESLLLEPTKSLGGALRPIRFLAEGTKSSDDSLLLEFKSASQVSHDLGAKGVREAQACSVRLDLPILTLILWNSSRSTAKDAALRKVFTQLTPRGELLRTGAGGFGELLSAPLPRSHPGYDSALKVRSFSIEEAASSLDALGFRRISPEKSRGDQSGGILKMLVMTQKGSSGLAEKIVGDSFNAVGIDLRIETDEKLYSDRADGQMLSWHVPWPALNFVTIFHSRSRHPWQSWLPHSQRLDKLLEEYSLSVSQGKPNYGTLKMVHRELFELEPAAVLMQHKVCLKSGSGFAGKTGHLDVRDPDWFWRLIF